MEAEEMDQLGPSAPVCDRGLRSVDVRGAKDPDRPHCPGEDVSTRNQIPENLRPLHLQGRSGESLKLLMNQASGEGRWPCARAGEFDYKIVDGSQI